MGADHASHGAGVSARGGRFPANSLGYVASEHDYIGARPFAREESESAKGPFKPQGGSFRESA